MTERDAAQHVLDALKLAQQNPPAEALADLNGLIPLVQGGGDQALEAGGPRQRLSLDLRSRQGAASRPAGHRPLRRRDRCGRTLAGGGAVG